MLKQIWPYSMLVILVFALGALFTVIYHEPKDFFEEVIVMNEPKIFSVPVKAPPSTLLVDPEEAPEDIKAQVMKGYRLFMETRRNAPAYVGNNLDCRSCHFRGGNTLGGRNGSISLVGVSHVYPRYSDRAGRYISLGERINNCFQRSLNGRPLPLKGEKMTALIAFLSWISKPVETFKEFPWLGLPKMTTTLKPDREKGEQLYLQHCAACHGRDGKGVAAQPGEEGQEIPPLWGEGSFNDGAGMSHLNNFAPFIWLNMPLNNSILTEEEAVHIGDYVLSQPRPHFEPGK